NSISIPSPSPLSRPPHCRSPPTTSFLIAVTMVRVTRKRTASKISSEIEPSLPPVPSKSTKVQKKSPPAATPTRRTSSRKAAIAQTPKSATPEAPAEETVEEKRVRLRNNWKFAATWQFFFNFSEAFKLKNIPIEKWEDELTGVLNEELVGKCLCSALE